MLGKLPKPSLSRRYSAEYPRAHNNQIHNRSLCRSAVSIIVLLTAVGLSSALECCAGGIWVAKLTVKNGDNVVFSDDFSNGKGRWRLGENVSIVKSQETPPAYLLFLDQHGKVCTSAFHPMSIKDPGVIEYSGMVYLPPVEEQANWQSKVISFTGLVVYSGSSGDTVAANVALRPGECGYRIRLVWNDYIKSGAPFGKGAQSGNVSTTSPMLEPKKWALLTLRLDPRAKTASALLDNQPVLQAAYFPERYPSIKLISVWGWLGSDPSKWRARNVAYAQPPKTEIHTPWPSGGTFERSLSVPASSATMASRFVQPVMHSAAAGGQLELSWPAAADGLQLYSATNLSPPVTWSWVTNSPVQSNNLQWLSLPMTRQQQYFRLQSP